MNAELRTKYPETVRGAENEVQVSVDLDGRGPLNRPAFKA